MNEVFENIIYTPIYTGKIASYSKVTSVDWYLVKYFNMIFSGYNELAYNTQYIIHIWLFMQHHYPGMITIPYEHSVIVYIFT